jgi:DNA-3-methyladenine glycosylase
VLPRSFYQRDARCVGPELLNKVLVAADGRCGRIVEVEAYIGCIDPAAHSFRGMTKRNATMFGRGGLLYVYFSYGMHWCCNAVCGEEGEGSGVLLRALEPLSGLPQMRDARPRARRDLELCSGPGRLSQAMGIGAAQNGIDLVAAQHGYTIVCDGTLSPRHPVGGPRIGISRGKDLLWRWCIEGNPHLSRP